MADATIDLLKNSSYVGKMDELIAAVKLGGSATSDVEWDNVKNKPTTIGGYGITDAKIENGTITLGNQTITPLTSAPVTSVNSKTGDVTLSAADVSAIPSTLTGTAGQVLTKTADGQEWKDVDIPTSLPNPNALTFTGAVTGSYDGSAPLSVEIPSGGGSGDVNHTLAVEVLASGTVNANSTDAVNTGVTLYTLKQYKLFLISVSGASNSSLQNWYTKVGNISIGRVNNFRAQTILYEFLNDEKTLMIAKSGTSGNHGVYLTYLGTWNSYGVVNAAMFADCVYDLSSLSDDTPVITYPTGASIDVNWSILGVTK